MRIRKYSELRQLQTFEERFEYLRLDGVVGRDTFGHERYINQRFYTSTQWRRARRECIARDYGLDLGMQDHPIYDKIVVHHMNPMIAEDIHGDDPSILDLEYLITTTHDTHNAIHYGDKPLRRPSIIERKPGDTIPW